MIHNIKNKDWKITPSLHMGQNGLIDSSKYKFGLFSHYLGGILNRGLIWTLRNKSGGLFWTPVFLSFKLWPFQDSFSMLMIIHSWCQNWKTTNFIFPKKWGLFWTTPSNFFGLCHISLIFSHMKGIIFKIDVLCLFYW